MSTLSMVTATAPLVAKGSRLWIGTTPHGALTEDMLQDIEALVEPFDGKVEKKHPSFAFFVFNTHQNALDASKKIEGHALGNDTRLRVHFAQKEVRSMLFSVRPRLRCT